MRTEQLAVVRAVLRKIPVEALFLEHDREVESGAEVLKSATVISAQVVRMEGKIGVIQPGAYADLLVVDGDPLEDLGLLAGQGEHLAAIMKEGRFYKNALGESAADAAQVRREPEPAPAG